MRIELLHVMTKIWYMAIAYHRFGYIKSKWTIEKLKSEVTYCLCKIIPICSILFSQPQMSFLPSKPWPEKPVPNRLHIASDVLQGNCFTTVADRKSCPPVLSNKNSKVRFDLNKWVEIGNYFEYILLFRHFHSLIKTNLEVMKLCSKTNHKITMS